MIVSLSPPTVKCQVGDFLMLVDPALPADSASVATLASPEPSAKRGSAKAAAGAKAGRPIKANLILYTEVRPFGFPLPPEVISGAGEYEISGVRVKGMNVDKKTVYSAEFEGIRLAFLGELGEEPTTEALGGLGTVDILFLRAESGKTKVKQVTTLIKQLDPRLIIPVGDKTARSLAEELGQKVRAEEKLVIRKKDLEKLEGAHKLVWLRS